MVGKEFWTYQEFGPTWQSSTPKESYVFKCIPQMHLLSSRFTQDNLWLDWWRYAEYRVLQRTICFAFVVSLTHSLVQPLCAHISSTSSFRTLLWSFTHTRNFHQLPSHQQFSFIHSILRTNTCQHTSLYISLEYMECDPKQKKMHTHTQGVITDFNMNKHLLFGLIKAYL